MDIKEIKFKGKRIDNGKWIEGDLISHSGYYVSDSTDCFNSMYEVNPETVTCDYIDNKDKVIELMAEFIDNVDPNLCKDTKEVIQYFENMAKDSK